LGFMWSLVNVSCGICGIFQHVRNNLVIKVV
jgi:hypothetical protein